MNLVSKTEILDGHNGARAAHHLHPLRRDAGLDKSAQRVANRLARADKGIAHSPVWWKVINKMTRRRFGAEGENLAANFSSRATLMSAWVHSPEHEANIVGPYTHCGIGNASASSGNTYYCVHFGGKR